MEHIVKDHPKDVIWVGGDINLPNVNWSNNSISGNNYRREISENLIQAMEKSGLEQIVDFPTRDRNLLDIFAINRPSLIQSCRPLPGVSDHERVLVNSDISAKYQCPVKRKIWLWAKADLPSLKEDMQSFSNTFLEENSIQTDVDTLRTKFSDKCTQLMTEHVPSKITTSRYSQPWINQDLKRNGLTRT